MYFKAITFTWICVFFSPLKKLYAQADSNSAARIAILAPLYLDSAFDNAGYKLGNINIPKQFLTGLEFFNGVMMAIDSLQKQGTTLDVWIYDTKKKGQTPESLATEMEKMHFSLIIASISNPSEQKVFSGFSFNNKIPLISATYPNDANVVANPFFVMVNSSLKTHIDAIYKYIQRNYPVGKLLYVTRKGSLEERIATIFADVGKRTAPLKYKLVEMPDSITTDQLLPLLDSNRQNIIICGSVNEAFSNTLLKVLNEASPAYQLVAIGMPTWDAMRSVISAVNANLDIVYSTPFNYIRSDKIIGSISNVYKQKISARPSDMFFKGYETMFCFSKLLLKYHNDLLNNLSDTSFNISGGYLLKPVKTDPNSPVPDYIENKKLYFIHFAQGKITAVN